MSEMIEFEPKQEPDYIMVIGVGGGGSNAVNHMFKQGIKGVAFTVCNTDAQALENSPVPNKIRIGNTNGLGAGSKPEVGEQAAKDSIEELKSAFKDEIKMVFITAGMGGGTGTGAAPIVAQLAREKEMLTVGIVTLPFHFEGRRRKQQAVEGIKNIAKYVDALLVINNDRLRELHGNLPVSEAFAKADDILTTAAKGIAEIITIHGPVNTDFEDVKTVMKDSGKAIMGSAAAEGEDRAIRAIEDAINSPLLNDNEIKGARNILLHIVKGTEEITMDEITEITEYVQQESGNEADLIWGQSKDESLGGKIKITLIATGFNKKPIVNDPPKRTHVLGQDTPVTSQPKSEEPAPAEKSEEKEASQSEFIRLTKRASNPEATEGKSSPTFDKPSNPETMKKDRPDENFSPPSAPEASSLESEDSQNIQIKSRVPDQSHLAIGRTVKDAGITVDVPKPQTMSPEDKTIKLNSLKRTQKLKELSYGNKKQDITEMESEPAYKRKNLELDNTPPSSMSQVSRFSLGTDSKNNPVIKSDNSFLHDNVD